MSRSPKTISCDLESVSTLARTLSTCKRVASAPIRTPSILGSPIFVLSRREEIPFCTSSIKSSGTIIRLIAVHFWPAFTVISLTVSLINKSNSAVPGFACKPKTVAFKESASKLNETLCEII